MFAILLEQLGLVHFWMGKGNIPFSLGAIMDMLMEKGKKLIILISPEPAQARCPKRPNTGLQLILPQGEQVLGCRDVL